MEIMIKLQQHRIKINLLESIKSLNKPTIQKNIFHTIVLHNLFRFIAKPTAFFQTISTSCMFTRRLQINNSFYIFSVKKQPNFVKNYNVNIYFK